jgi:hypothetical protein
MVAVGLICSVGSTTAVVVPVGIAKLIVGIEVDIGSTLTSNLPQAVSDTNTINTKSFLACI